MELIIQLKDMFAAAGEYVPSKNFYFEKHECPVKQETVKVDLKYVIKNEDSDKIVKLGQCLSCGTTYYHEDFDIKRL